MTPLETGSRSPMVFSIMCKCPTGSLSRHIDNILYVSSFEVHHIEMNKNEKRSCLKLSPEGLAARLLKFVKT